MNTKMFYSHYNTIFKPKNFERYIGKKYQYGNSIITIVGIYNDSYFETTSTLNSLKVCMHIESFLSDVNDGIYKEVK